MAELEIFTPAGVLAGSSAQIPLTVDGPDLLEPLRLQDARWYPIDGSPPSALGEASVEPDDILLVAVPEPELHVHMASFPIVVDVRPYRVSGLLATHPGFDPERALARPSGAFVALREATIELPRVPDAGAAERRYLHVNRYAVEAVSSSLMLGFFFPGARFLKQEPVSAA